MSDEFDFRDEGEKNKVEASLDDFFQPTEEEVGAGAEELPIEKDRVKEIKPEPEVQLVEEEPKKKEKKKKVKKSKEKKAKEKKLKPAGEKSPVFKYLLIILIIILVLGGGYFAYTKFFAQPRVPEVVKKPPKPAPKPTPIKPAPGKPKTQPPLPSEAKPSPIKPTPIKPQPQKPTPAQTSKPAPTPHLTTLFALPNSAPAKGWSCQVGAYMLKESMETPFKKLRSAGFNNLYYVDTERNLKIYHLYLQGEYDLQTAQAKKSSLEKLGFKPRLENKAGKYKVLIYSYGSSSVAQKAKSKVEQAGIGKGEIISRREKVILHQLRVGPYSSKTQAIRIKSKLQNLEFHPIIIEEK